MMYVIMDTRTQGSVNLKKKKKVSCWVLEEKRRDGRRTHKIYCGKDQFLLIKELVLVVIASLLISTMETLAR